MSDSVASAFVASLSTLEQRRLAYSSFVSTRLRLVYVETPKVACSTMKRLLAELEGETDVENANRTGWEIDPDLLLHGRTGWRMPSLLTVSADVLNEALTSAEYLRFCLVRNPFTRAFSAWQSKILLREPLQIGPLAGLDFYERELRGIDDLRLAFEGFLAYLYREEWPDIENPHWAPQTSLLLPDRLPYTLIGKVERLPATWEILERHLAELQTRLPQIRRSNQGLLPWDPLFLTPRAEELVRTLYEADFESFEYDRSPPPGGGRSGTGTLATALRAVEMIRGRHERFTDIHTLLDETSEQLGVLTREREGDRTTLAEREERIRLFEAEVSSLRADLGELKARFGEALAERERLIEQQQSALADQSNQIEQQQCALADQSSRIEQQQCAMAAYGNSLREISERNAELERSIAWRATRPLRAAGRILEKLIAACRRRLEPSGRARGPLFGRVVRRWRARSEARLVESSGLFDAAWYLRANPDVEQARTDPLRHYLICGAFERRNPNPLFDSGWYLAHYPDVSRSGWNPLVHYLVRGAWEGRDAGPAFDTARYLSEHPELYVSRENPLAHRLRTGAVQSRPSVTG